MVEARIVKHRLKYRVAAGASRHLSYNLTFVAHGWTTCPLVLRSSFAGSKVRASRREVLSGLLLAAAGASPAAGRAAAPVPLSAPGEFEPQDYIWLPWVERGFFGAAPFCSVAIEVMKAITPHVRVRLLHSGQLPLERGQREPPLLDRRQSEARVRGLLASAGVDVGRVELVHHPLAYGSIQDPGPYFLRTSSGLALADYRLNHPDPRAEAMDRAIAAALALPTIRSELVSEGGGRQSNGRGTLLLVRAVEQARNPRWSIADIEKEHLRMHGASKVVWLEQGPAEEEWGKLADGRWGIGTGGHVDVFARFADVSTVLLAEVSQEQRDCYPILARTHERMERNHEILRAATDQDGRAFNIIRVPVPDPLTAMVKFDDLLPQERSWFEGARPGDLIEYYLPAGYLNFIIANGVVVMARLEEPGRPERFRQSDQDAKLALERAFPGRKIVQLGVTPLLHDGAGLHCHSRNQPAV
jgi:agmatine deiminase